MARLTTGTEATAELDAIIQQAESLPADQQLRLAAHLLERALTMIAPGARRRWSEIYASATFPLLGEDAQHWVSRTRHEADHARDLSPSSPE